MSSNIEKYGWTAVPRDPAVVLAAVSGSKSQAVDFDSAIALPDSELIRKCKDFVQKSLNEPTFNHSMRVYTYGAALAQHHFPTWNFPAWQEAYFLSCLFHDIGTGDAYLSNTASKMSFEFKGAIVAREFILKHGGEEDLADAVCEAVIRHQDVLVNGGNITMAGQLLQLTTLIDNVGANADLIHPSFIDKNIQTFPRLKWASCFCGVIEKETSLKPWCHTTTFERPAYGLSLEYLQGLGMKGTGQEGNTKNNFASDVSANKLMNSFE